MKLHRILLFCAILIIAVSWFSKPRMDPGHALHLPRKKTGRSFDAPTETKLKQKVVSARSFVLAKGYNNKICFFIDMSLPSGQPRFFIYDMVKDSLLNLGLVAHGNCFEYWLEGRRYSNVVGSGCTSLGKYRISYPYTGKFGYSYKLYGLDSTNNNAFERTVVLHSHSCVPEKEVTDDICQSNGCPTVSPGFLEQLKGIINSSKKPVLLWIYE
jgi:hypothetical protein